MRKKKSTAAIAATKIKNTETLHLEIVEYFIFSKLLVFLCISSGILYTTGPEAASLRLVPREVFPSTTSCLYPSPMLTLRGTFRILLMKDWL